VHLLLGAEGLARARAAERAPQLDLLLVRDGDAVLAVVEVPARPDLRPPDTGLLVDAGERAADGSQVQRVRLCDDFEGRAVHVYYLLPSQ
jgi:hypothetical protein